MTWCILSRKWTKWICSPYVSLRNIHTLSWSASPPNCTGQLPCQLRHLGVLVQVCSWAACKQRHLSLRKLYIYIQKYVLCISRFYIFLYIYIYIYRIYRAHSLLFVDANHLLTYDIPLQQICISIHSNLPFVSLHWKSLLGKLVSPDVRRVANNAAWAVRKIWASFVIWRWGPWVAIWWLFRKRVLFYQVYQYTKTTETLGQAVCDHKHPPVRAQVQGVWAAISGGSPSPFSPLQELDSLDL